MNFMNIYSNIYSIVQQEAWSSQ